MTAWRARRRVLGGTHSREAHADTAMVGFAALNPPYVLFGVVMQKIEHFLESFIFANS